MIANQPIEPGRSATPAPWTADDIDQARRTVLEVMRGNVEDGAVRLAAARFVLSPEFVEHLSDDALWAECSRRLAASES